jgi:hypothetical protein
MAYITCTHRKSYPKIHVSVCEKCRHMKKCVDYWNHIQPSLFPGIVKEMKKAVKPKRAKLESIPLPDKPKQLSLEM